MKKVQLKDITIKRRINNGEGEAGICYSTVDDLVFKRFKYFLPEYHETSRITGIKNDVYVLPSSVVYDDDMIVGVLYPYIKSQTLFEKNLPYQVLVDNIGSLYKATDDLSNHNISSFDIRRPNILYPGSFKIIDTDMYYKIKNPNKNSKDILERSNITNINLGILDIIGFDRQKCGDASVVKKFIDSRKMLSRLYEQLIGSKDNRVALEFLIEFRNFLEQAFDSEVDYVNDAKILCRKWYW